MHVFGVSKGFTGSPPSSGAMMVGYTAPSDFQYLVQDYAADIATDDIQSKLNSLGAEGWQLLFVSQSGDHVRAWFIRGVSHEEKALEENQEQKS